jgi:predicted Fe-S protein YdhL (DUF1289 family)
MKSPCIKICKTIPEGMCIGCGRTIEEIQKWASYPENQKQMIMDTLPDRLKDLVTILRSRRLKS